MAIGKALLEKYNTSQFEKDLAFFSFSLTERQLCQFLRYYELLAEWNSFMNLTAITEFEEVMKKHFIDSLSLVKTGIILKNQSLMDVGTGAGFPGIPLKIVYPDLEITLLDSLHKRITFLEEVIKELEITGIQAVHGRAEDMAKPGVFRGSFDLCVSRAVANLSTLSEYCIPFLKKGGKFISYKSEKVSEEIEISKKAVSLFGGKILSGEGFYLPDSDIYRNLVVIEKEKETPKKFPRKAGLPAKEPIL